MRRMRVTEAHTARLAGRLSPRDYAIVETLDRTRVATAKQLERLHFYASTPRANTRAAQRGLRRLTELRVLAELSRRVGGPTGGSAQPVYALDTAGLHLASACGPAGGRRIRRPWTPGALFLAHALAVTELYVRLVERTRGAGGELVAFNAEPACWRSFTGPGGGRIWLKPDAFVRFARGDYEYASFVEVDRATASLPTVTRKAQLYARYWQTGREQQRCGVFPKVVILAPGERRRATIAGRLTGGPAAAGELFAVHAYRDAVAVLTGEVG